MGLSLQGSSRSSHHGRALPSPVRLVAVPSLTSPGFLSSPTHARRPDSVLCWRELGMSRITPAAP